MAKLTIQRKTPQTIPMTFSSSGVAYDLTDKTVLVTFRSLTDTADNDDSAVLKKSITVHTDPTAGKTTLSLTVSDATIAEGTYKWDARIMNGETVVGNTTTDYVYVLDIVTHRPS